MKQLAAIAFLGLLTALPAAAQGYYDGYDRDRRDYPRYERDRDRDGYYGRDRYPRYEDRRYDDGRYGRWGDDRRRWNEPNPYDQRRGYGYGEPPKLSDMQQRALDNCAMLAPRDQPRCRATVLSTVRR